LRLLRDTDGIAVQAQLAINRISRRHQANATDPSLLAVTCPGTFIQL